MVLLLYALIGHLGTKYGSAQLNSHNCGSIISRKISGTTLSVDWSYVKALNNVSSVGLFDWKKDRKFLARFEEPISPDKESPTEDGVFFFCLSHFFLSSSACSISTMTGSFSAFCLLSHCLCEAGAQC